MKTKIIATLSAIAITIVLLAAGVAAYQWLNFTGDEQIEQSDNDVEEILSILKDTHAGKLSAEQALAKIEEERPPGLNKKIKELEAQLEQAHSDNAQLNTDLAALAQERDQLVIARDNAVAERDDLQAQYDTLNDGYTAIQEELTLANEYVDHLEAELSAANEAVANHAQSTKAAVEEARTYKE